jgi:hypothetical protein
MVLFTVENLESWTLGDLGALATIRSTKYHARQTQMMTNCRFVSILLRAAGGDTAQDFVNACLFRCPHGATMSVATVCEKESNILMYQKHLVLPQFQSQLGPCMFAKIY